MRPTIAAIATAAGRAGVGIIRISGPLSGDLLQKIAGLSASDEHSHRMRLATFRDADGVVDRGLAVYFKGPSSYTGEDVVEFQCHAGPVILQRMLDACLENGARLAAPGEFTQRAYLNQRLDLTQAEAVVDLINATTESAHKLAMEHLDGALGQTISGHLEALVEAMVLVESAIDFSHEEHIYSLEYDEIRDRITRVATALTGLAKNFDAGRRQRDGIYTAILGPTNAGKSTLFNTLYGSDRAIVSDIEGTTRDFLEEEIRIGTTALRMIDTAGFRDTDDAIEVQGIARSQAKMDRADLLVWVIDQSAPIPEDTRDRLQAALQDPRPTLLVRNKTDRPPGLAQQDETLVYQFSHTVSVSLTDQKNVEELRTMLSKLAAQMTAAEGVLLSRTRHLEAVRDTLEALQRATASLDAEVEHELVALDLREALDALGRIVGKVTTDDILNRIFSDFCVGK